MARRHGTLSGRSSGPRWCGLRVGGRVALVLAAAALAQGSSCLDDDPPDPAAARCCAVCTEGVPCGDGCAPSEAECEEEPGCACAAVPEPGSACANACDREATCGFRDAVACIGESCMNDGARVGGETADACLLAAADCAEAAQCACPDGCAKTDECTGSEDAACEETCATLVEQLPEATYRENRCKIERACEDLALCGS